MHNTNTPLLFRLPPEIRLHIYEYVIGSRVVYVRMFWSGVCIPSGFSYRCLEDTQALLENQQTDVLAKAIPFGPDMTVLSKVSRQMRKETAILPFQFYIWAFETAWTMDQFVCMKREIPVEYKNAIRMVAVPTPGPYQASEKVLADLHTVLLVGKFKKPEGEPEDLEAVSDPSKRGILTLRRAKTGNAWIRSDEQAVIVQNSSS